MLTSSTHIRPLLRVPAHQPDLFTSNPSLLHHFQQQGIVAQGAAQAASGSGGAAGGAGRAGYSSASGGGYTGHARAFLSLPQTHADASSVSISTDERKDKAAANRARQQFAINGRVRREEPTLPRTVMVRERLTERQGSRQVRVIEVEQEEPKARRSTITYPAWAALPAETGPSAPVWIAGAAPRPLGVRAYSTQNLVKEAEYVSSTPPPEFQHLSQKNRVLQDLAGLDIGRPSHVGQVRRNSTASAVRPSAPRSPDEVADRMIYDALRSEENSERQDRIMRHYLSPRDGTIADAEMAKEFPLPAGYSTAGYNSCLTILLQRRERGGSIAPILDIYNEMLARDVVPNLLTSRLVISALCAREEDVSAASRRWGYSQDLEKLKHEQLGTHVSQDASEKNAAEAIEAYQSEDNLASAISLWKIITAFNSRSPANSAILQANNEILSAAVTAIGLPHATPVEKLLPLIDVTIAGDKYISSFEAIFALIAAEGANAKKYLPKLDQALEVCSELEIGEHKVRAAEAFSAAIQAYIAAGETGKAEAVLKRFGSGGKGNTGARFSARLHDAMINGFAKSNQLDLAMEWAHKHPEVINHDTFGILADRLIENERAAEALQLYRQRKAVPTSEAVRDFHPESGRMLPFWARLVHKAQVAKGGAKKDALDVATDFVVTATPRVDIDILDRHVNLLCQAGRFNDVSNLMMSFPAGSARSAQQLRVIIANAAKSDAPLSDVLKMVRAAARLGMRTESRDQLSRQWSLASVLVQRYLADRANLSKAADLNLSPDAWFRLVEAFVSMPSPRVDRGESDEAFKTVMMDLAEVQKATPDKLNGLAKSPIIAELAEILVARFGAQASHTMLFEALGETAAAHVPTPTEVPSTPEFSLPPTADAGQAPPSSLQPPSAHTLHISPQIVALIERLGFAHGPEPEMVYAKIRQAITKENAVPSPEAIARLIVALARANDEAKVRELYSLAQVVLASCVPDSRSQAEAWCAVEDAMIASCCILGHLEQAGIHRARIIEAGFAPSADAYATMIASSRDSTDDALVARELFEESQRLGVVPHLYLYNTIISKLSKARKAEMAIELFTHMKSVGIRPSSVTYGAVINACCRVGDAESATTLFEEMSKQPNFKPRVPPYK